MKPADEPYIVVKLNGRVVTEDQRELFQRDLRLFCSVMNARITDIDYLPGETVYSFVRPRTVFPDSYK